MSPQKYYNNITLLKILATFLITWFHLKPYVPNAIQPLFIGGVFGNALFFFSSGFLLRIKKENFPGEWILHKFIRIMPSVWIASIFLIFTSHKLDWYEWIYPTHFWFINAILCFFFIYWIAHKWIDKYPIKTVLITVSIHIIWYITQVNYAELSLDSTGIKVWFYNFIIFLLGNQIGKQSEKFKNKSSSIYLPVICIILFFGYKTLCKSYPQLCFWQFIIIPIIIFFFTFFTYRAVNILAQIKVSNYTQQILSQISNMTLDIYVVQIAVIQIINKHNLLFPLNIIVMLISISIASYLCYLISNKIAKFITNHIMIKFLFQRR